MSTHLKKALYAGTFDPPTLAHLDLIQRSASIFDELIVCIAVNKFKNDNLLSSKERIDLFTELLKDHNNIRVVSTDKLVFEFAKEHHISCFVRGIRSTIDFEFENALSTANFQQAKIDTFFLMSNPEFRHITASLVREIYSFNGSVHLLVPPLVNDYLEKKRT